MCPNLGIGAPRAYPATRCRYERAKIAVEFSVEAIASVRTSERVKLVCGLIFVQPKDFIGVGFREIDCHPLIPRLTCFVVVMVWALGWSAVDFLQVFGSKTCGGNREAHRLACTTATKHDQNAHCRP